MLTAYTWLLVLTPWYTAWWVLTWNIMTFTFDVHAHRSNHIPLHRAPCPRFPNRIPSRPKQTSYSPLPRRSMYILTLGPLSFHRKSTIQSSVHWKVFPSAVFQGHPCVGLQCSHNLFLACSFILSHLPANKAWFFSLKLDIRSFSGSHSRAEEGGHWCKGDG